MQTNKPRLEALKKVVYKVVKARGKKQKEVALDAFDTLNDDGWNTCAVGAFLNDCGIDVKQMAKCKDTGLSVVVNSLVQPEIKTVGGHFESLVHSRRKGNPQRALNFLNKLIRSKPCTILKV